MIKRIKTKLAVRRLTAAIARKPQLCRRCIIQWNVGHRPCFAVGCECKCS